MFRISSERELLETFRLLDRPEVELPRDLAYPLFVRDYLTWSEPSGHRVYLVFSEQARDPARGIVFRRESSGPGAQAQMCDWCHATASGNSVGLLTATSTGTRRVGLSLCRDLGCKQLTESSLVTDSHRRLRQILKRMGDFSRQNLF